jgi:hypothetical protein
MTFLTFLNELSYPTGPLSQGEARYAVGTLIDVLRKLKNERADLALHSSAPLTDVPLGDNFWMRSLRADGKSIDEWRFLRALDNRAPFHIGLVSKVDEDVDFEFEGIRAIGLGLAHNFDALAVSFAREPWLRRDVELDRMELQSDGSIYRELVRVRNASVRDHIETLRSWCLAMPLAAPIDGDDLWTNRVNRFPRLRFLSHVERQIRALKAGTPELIAINQRLLDIQNALAEWDIVASPLPNFRTKVTPEYEQRREKFKIADTDGRVQYFDLHARYTPGAGRIHMWCDRSTGTASIGHVGEKVP